MAVTVTSVTNCCKEYEHNNKIIIHLVMKKNHLHTHIRMPCIIGFYEIFLMNRLICHVTMEKCISTVNCSFILKYKTTTILNKKVEITMFTCTVTNNVLHEQGVFSHHYYVFPCIPTITSNQSCYIRKSH